LPTALVTGGAGFIGSHVVDRLLADGWTVTTFDNFDPFYPEAVKLRNIAAHAGHPRFTLVRGDLRDRAALSALAGEFDAVVHLAAKAGVRPSLDDPTTYQEVNVGGTQNLLEWTRARGVRQFLFASSSSVYGVNPSVPWREDEAILRPISPYAATKIAGELMGHVYSHLFGIRFLALRFFTVYGPRQRPDLAIHKFGRRMLAGQPIPVYGDGSMRRDYTYVGDLVDGIRAALDYDRTPFEIINLGNHRTVSLVELIDALEDVIGVRAVREPAPDQPGDVPVTYASIDKAAALLGYHPRTDLRDGLRAFAGWLAGEP
jgi:UDP-glucuronate 4-epimerase